MSIVLAIREAKVGMTAVKGQSGQKCHKTPSQPMAGYSGVHLFPGYIGKQSRLAWA
jgi:hypothetical protein